MNNPGRVPPMHDLMAILKDIEPIVNQVLPANMDSGRLFGLMLNEAKKNPNLYQSTPESITMSVMRCAQLGLEPGILDQCYLIPIWNKNLQGFECTFQTGYKGLIELITRGGTVSTIEAREVCEHDTFRLVHGTKKELYHEPFIDGPRGNVKGFYCLVEMKDGGHIFDYMSMAEVQEHRAQNDKRKTGSFSPWDKNFNGMAKKTVVKRTIKLLPVSAIQKDYIQDFINKDEQAQDMPEHVEKQAQAQPKAESMPEPMADIRPPAQYTPGPPNTRPRDTTGATGATSNKKSAYDPYNDPMFYNSIPPERGRNRG